MTKFVMIMDGRTIGGDGTISDVPVISIVWLVMIGDSASGGLPVCPPAPRNGNGGLSEGAETTLFFTSPVIA